MRLRRAHGFRLRAQRMQGLGPPSMAVIALNFVISDIYSSLADCTKRRIVSN